MILGVGVKAVRRWMPGRSEDFLQFAEDPGDVQRDRKKAKVAVALEGFGDKLGVCRGGSRVVLDETIRNLETR